MSEVLGLAEATRVQCAMLRDFMNDSARTYVDRFAGATLGGVTIQGTFLRVLAWMQTLARLNEPADFQAAIAGSRALFEVAIDLTLINHEPKYPVTMLEAWEDWARLGYAKRLRRAYEGKDPPEHIAPIIAFAETEGDAIRKLRKGTWPDKDDRDLQRWTGNKLNVDVEIADKHGPHEFKAFYQERFAPLCWNTHGSGLAGVRRLTPSVFPGLIAQALGECVRHGFIACEQVLHFFPATRHDGVVFEKLRKIALEGGRAGGDVLRQNRRQTLAAPPANTSRHRP